MSLALFASKWKPELTACGFTSLNITHRVSDVRAGKDAFELSFTDQQGQEYSIKLYSESSDTDIIVDDGTAARINRPDVDLLDTKKFLSKGCIVETTRDAYAAESAASEINERVVIDL